MDLKCKIIFKINIIKFQIIHVAIYFSVNCILNIWMNSKKGMDSKWVFEMGFWNDEIKFVMQIEWK
jgi:hypothetical protein